MTQVKKSHETQLAIQSINLNFSSFYKNTQCLVRQEVWLLNKKLKLIIIIIISRGFIKNHPTNLKTHTLLNSNLITHKPYANVLVINNSNK
jgi:hypothetical protein